MYLDERFRATLVTSASDAEVLTKVHMSDARTALVRSLCHYLAAQEMDWWDGTRVRFESIHENWPETEEQAEYPSVCVLEGQNPPQYSDAWMAPDDTHEFDDGAVLYTIAALRMDFALDIYCTSDEERVKVAALLERAMFPVPWSREVRMRVPFYHGAYATFRLEAPSFVDSTDQDQRRYHRATVSGVGEINVFRVSNPLPRLNPRVSVVTVAPDGTRTPAS